jgi:Zn/Cd-binding protein ZinT
MKRKFRNNETVMAVLNSGVLKAVVMNSFTQGSRGVMYKLKIMDGGEKFGTFVNLAEYQIQPLNNKEQL